MRTRLHPEECERFLADVHPDESFWINNGPVVRNLYEFGNALASMSDKVFEYHSNDARNDFADWIEHSIRDKTLGKMLRSAKKRKRSLRMVKRRIAHLEDYIHKHKMEKYGAIDVDIMSRAAGWLTGKPAFLVYGLALGIVVGMILFFYS